jgi:hypothetical protein
MRWLFLLLPPLRNFSCGDTAPRPPMRVKIKGRFGTPVEVGTMEGSRFYPDPVCTHILETPRLRGGRVRAGGSRERLLTPLQPTVIHFVSYQSNTINQAASWDVSGSRLLDNVSEIRRCLHDQLRLRATFKSGSPPGARPPHQVTAIA